MDQPQQPYVKPDGSIGVKPAQFNEAGDLVPDPTWVQFLKEHMRLNQEPLFENLPVQLNLGPMSTQDTVGWADAYREMLTGKTIITITLDRETSQALYNLAEVFELKAIGFAGIKRKPAEGGEQN
jgi:hypothetical protein